MGYLCYNLSVQTNQTQKPHYGYILQRLRIFCKSFFSEGDERIAASLIETSDDPLWKIEQLVDFEALRPVIEERLRAFKPLCLGYKSASTLSSRNGRPALDPLLMFKIVFIQMQFNLSDHAVVVQIKDRVSFRRFLNISYDLVPGASTVWNPSLVARSSRRILESPMAQAIGFFLTCLKFL